MLTRIVQTAGTISNKGTAAAVATVVQIAVDCNSTGTLVFVFDMELCSCQ